MKQLTDGVWRLDEPIAPLINIYVAGDVLIDAGRRQDHKRVFRQLAGRDISMVALTHAHPDHQGVAKAVCDERGVELACHADDVEAMEGRRPMSNGSFIGGLVNRRFAGPARRVDRVLHEGDEVGGFRVIHAPGHSAGEIILFRDADRVAICGDVIRNLSYATLRSVVKEPPDGFNDDTALNRASIRKLAQLEPSLVLPGHGDAITDVGELARLAEVVSS